MKPELKVDILELLEELLEELDNRSDILDGDYETGPRPNWAMRLHQRVEDILPKIENET